MNKTILSICICLLSNHLAWAQLNFSNLNQVPIPCLNQMDSAILSGKYERIQSVLIAKKGEVLFEKYYHGSDVNSTHNTRSATKTMATLLTGIAIKHGHISSEKDKIFQYLQHKKPVQNPDPRKEEITLEDLLTMSSVLECNDFNSFSRGNEERMYIIEDWAQFYLDLPIRSYPFEPKPEDQAHGRAFSYCSAGAALMAEIVQTAVKMPLDQYAQKHLFEPLGITDYQLDYTPQGILNTAGGSNYRSRDFLKLIQLCLNQGKWNGEEILPATWLQKATRPQAQVQEGMEYGYLFWLRNFGKGPGYPAYCMAGNGGQKILALPELEACVVITTTNYGNRNAHNYTDELLNEYIVPALLDF